jgi:hypothetical protein
MSCQEFDKECTLSHLPCVQEESSIHNQDSFNPLHIKFPNNNPLFNHHGTHNYDSFRLLDNYKQFHVNVCLSLDVMLFSSGCHCSNLGDLKLSGLAEDEEEDDEYAKECKSTSTTGCRCVKWPTASDNLKPIWMVQYKKLLIVPM